MIVADTSAWLEFLRGTGHPAHLALAGLLREGADLAITEVVVMEVLAGTRPGRRLAEIRSTLLALPLLRAGLIDYEEAAAIYRTCRARGETIRGLLDCLVAASAMRADAPLLHNDRDFDAIARHTDLRIYQIGA